MNVIQKSEASIIPLKTSEVKVNMLFYRPAVNSWPQAKRE